MAPLPLTPEQRQTYEAAAAFWVRLLPIATGKRAGAIFWGEHLRFFQQLLLVPVVDGETQRDLVGWKVPAAYRKEFDDGKKKAEAKAEAKTEKKAATKAKKEAKKVGLVSV